MVQFSQGSYTVTENEQVVELQVERFGSLDYAVEILIQTQPGSATGELRCYMDHINCRKSLQLLGVHELPKVENYLQHW